MRSPRLNCLAAWMVVAACLHAASFDDRVETLLRPPLGERMALSPDGQRVAYTAWRDRHLSVVVMDLDDPRAKRTVPADPNYEAPFAINEPPARLRFLRWATATRLVYAPTERIVPLPPIPDPQGRLGPNPDGPTIVSPILAIDADGRQRGTLVDARHFQETPAEARKSLADLLRTTKELAATRGEPVRWRMPHLDILGFMPREREQLILQTRGAYSIPALHLLDIRTGDIREFGGEWPAAPGEPQIYDWLRFKVVGERMAAARPTIAWHDRELAGLQRELELKFPRRVVELLDWNDARDRVLLRVTGGSDPGRIFIYQRTEDIVLEILRCAPWLTAAKLNDTRFLEFAAPDGAPLSGYLTWPKAPRLTPPPLLVVFPSEFPGGAQPAFDPEAQVFADLGFVVARLNHRSVAGVRPQDLPSRHAAIDRVSVEDAIAAIDEIAARFPERSFDRRRVAALGRGLGGYLALRALQLQPEAFHCGVAIDAPPDPRAQLAPATTDWRKLSVVDHLDALARPVLLLVEPGRQPAIDAAAEALGAGLRRLGRPVERIDLDPGFAAARPESRAFVYRKIGEFLDAHLPGLAGATKEVQ